MTTKSVFFTSNLQRRMYSSHARVVGKNLAIHNLFRSEKYIWKFSFVLHPDVEFASVSR